MAMPIDYRAELTALRAVHGDLVRKYDTISKEAAQLTRERRAFAGRCIKLQLRNSQLSAAHEQISNSVKSIASHGMWMKETVTLELMMERWDVTDRAELMLRLLYRARNAKGVRLFHDVPAALERLSKPGNWAAETRARRGATRATCRSPRTSRTTSSSRPSWRR